MTAPPLRIGTRGSALALAQAALVARAMDAHGVAHETVVLETAGDRRAPDTAWGEGAFVTAIEGALVAGRIDVAVHSAKDVPTDEDPRLSIRAYLPRAEARDALVLPPGVEATLLTLPAGTVVGTDSPRRAGFVRASRPDLEVRPLHGNVDTRLRRLDDGAVGALVLAAAGLIRLGLQHRITELLPVEVVPPAPGQGAIAVQVRADDEVAQRVVGVIDDPVTRASVEAERAFLAATGGGCRAPTGALAQIRDDALELVAGTATRDGRVVLMERGAGTIEGRVALARTLAQRIVEGRAAVLEGPPVLLTRAERDSHRLAGRLADLGIRSAVVPTIEVQHLDVGAIEVDRYDFVVATSASAVRAVSNTGPGTARVRWAAVGHGTARELRAMRARDIWMPSTANGAALARELPVSAGERVLWLRGDIADARLSAVLRERGAVVDELVVYRTLIGPGSSGPLLRAALADERPAAIVFASPSAVRGLLSLSTDAEELLGIPVVVVGTTTGDAARAAGFGQVAVAPSPDPDAVAETVSALLSRESK